MPKNNAVSVTVLNYPLRFYRQDAEGKHQYHDLWVLDVDDDSPPFPKERWGYLQNIYCVCCNLGLPHSVDLHRVQCARDHRVITITNQETS